MWIGIVALGSGGIGHLLLNWAHGHVELAVMSLLTLGVPVVVVLSAAVFLDEAVAWVQVAGMGIVIAALGVVAVETRRAVAEDPAPAAVAEPAAPQELSEPQEP